MKPPWPVWCYWFYCLVSTVFSLALAAAGITLAWQGNKALIQLWPDAEFVPEYAFKVVGIGGAMTFFCTGIGSLFLAFRPRNPQAHKVHFGNLIVGAGTCILLPFALPALLNWNKPDVKRYFEGSPDDKSGQR